MRYSVYTTLVALVALGVRAEQKYCDGAEKDPTGTHMTDPFAADKSASLTFPNGRARYRSPGSQDGPGTTSMLDCFKECQLLQPPADKVGDELNDQYSQDYCRGVRYWEFPKPENNKCFLMKVAPTEVKPTNGLGKTLGFFGGGMIGQCSDKGAKDLSEQNGVDCCEIWLK